MKKFEAHILIYEPNLDGNFHTKPHRYNLESDKEITLEEVEEIIYQALEIERIYKGEILVEIEIRENGEYYEDDECIVEVDIHLTEKKSSFVSKSNPPIYKIDREKSSIKFLIDDAR